MSARSLDGEAVDTSNSDAIEPLQTFDTLLPCAQKRLVLFDIDGTLIRCGRQVGPMFLDSMNSVFGSRGAWQGFSFSGKTDPQIVVELLEREGFDRQHVIQRLDELRELYLPRIEQELDPAKMTLLPGVLRLLKELESQADMHLGLVTGNWERGGRAKLAAFDLNRFFDYGGFGEDGVAREDLPPAAMRRASESAGRSFAPEEVLIVGDTPNDVRCAHAHGIQCLAVTTGFVDSETLAAAGADWIVSSLEHLGVPQPVGNQ